MISSSACVGGLASQELLCASYVHGVHLTRAEDLTWREIVTLDWPCTPRKTIGAEWVWVTSHHVAIYPPPLLSYYARHAPHSWPRLARRRCGKGAASPAQPAVGGKVMLR